MNKPVSFSLAKLLKEKDFNNIECKGYYHVCDGYTEGYAFCYSNVYTQEEIAILAPTISDVVMWIYEKYGIWINVERYSTLFRCYAEEIGDERFGKWEGHKYKSPTEAYEVAIEYTLTHLINQFIMNEKTSFNSITYPHDYISSMTIRGHFATMAMQGLLTRTPKTHNDETDLGVIESKRIAEESVIMADALIKALNNE